MADDKQIADLTKRAERAEKLATLTDAQRAHHNRLSGDAAEAFLAKSFDERQKDIEPVYTSESTGAVYTKGDDARAIELAKRVDAQAKEIAKRDEMIEKAEIRKFAAEHLGGLTGDDDTHDLVIRSLRKSGADAASLEKAYTAMKGWRAIAKAAGTPNGSNESDDGDQSKDAAYKRLETELVKFCDEKKIEKVWTEGLTAFVKTSRGAELKRAHDEAK